MQRVADELRQIAALLEDNLVAEATQNLRRNILTTTSDVSALLGCAFLMGFSYFTDKIFLLAHLCLAV